MPAPSGSLAPSDVLAPGDGLIVVELDLAQPRSGTPDWADITGYGVLQISPSTRGRQHELDRFEAGTTSLILDNSDRTFDPMWDGSVFWPNIKPGRRIRARVPGGRSDGTDAYLFTMFVERFPPTWEGPEYGETRIEATDALAVLAAYTLVADFPAQTTGARVNAVLDAIGWPTADRSVGTGVSFLPAASFAATDNVNALQHLQDVADTENGMLFADGQGWVVFIDRHAAISAPYTESQWTFSDGDYEDDTTQFTFDWDLVYNVITCTDAAGIAVTASDAASEDDYLPRSLSRQLLIATGTTEPSDAANFLLSQHKDPALRLPQLVFKPCLDPNLMQQTLDREIGDRITVIKTPPTGDPIELDFFIEQISNDLLPGDDQTIDWTTTFGLAPADTRDWFIFDTSTFDGTAVFAY